jgi:LPS sulfotransferase NodH
LQLAEEHQFVSDNSRVRAIILTTQRSGSTFLVDCLRSHPDIHCAGEILNGQPDDPRPPYRGPFKQAVKLMRIVKSGAWRPANRMGEYFAGGHAKVRCFKAMYNQLRRPFALAYLREHKDVHVMHLRRQNLLKVHVSTLLMPKRKQLQATGPVQAVWIKVDPAAAISALRKAQAQYDQFEKAFEHHPRIHLTYESLIDGAQLQGDAARQICEFLGVSQHPMRSQLTKLNPNRLQDMVTNYDELAAAVSRTEFAKLLD